MAEILWAPSPERRITTNLWAFLQWLRTTRGIALAGWEALARWSETHPRAFAEALHAFAGPGNPAELAARLLFLDLRPDDRILAVTAFAGLPANLPPPAPALLSEAADHRATILIAPSKLLAEATAQNPARADLTPLRTLLAIGGPMSPPARSRIYCNVKSDLLLLAAAGDRVWGDPLSPVLARPQPAPALGRPKPPPSTPDAP